MDDLQYYTAYTPLLSHNTTSGPKYKITIYYVDNYYTTLPPDAPDNLENALMHITNADGSELSIDGCDDAPTYCDKYDIKDNILGGIENSVDIIRKYAEILNVNFTTDDIPTECKKCNKAQLHEKNAADGFWFLDRDENMLFCMPTKCLDGWTMYGPNGTVHDMCREDPDVDLYNTYYQYVHGVSEWPPRCPGIEFSPTGDTGVKWSPTAQSAWDDIKKLDTALFQRLKELESAIQ